MQDQCANGYLNLEARLSEAMLQVQTIFITVRALSDMSFTWLLVHGLRRNPLKADICSKFRDL